MSRQYSLSFNESNSSTDEEVIEKYSQKKGLKTGGGKRSYEDIQRPKSATRNALIARANRLKKKKYLQALEEELNDLRYKNSKLNAKMNTKSSIITDLQSEVKYLKSILMSSSDISNLLKAINGKTGMPATTSLNSNLTFQTDSVSNSNYASFPTPDSASDYLNTYDLNDYEESDFQFNLGRDLLSNWDIKFDNDEKSSEHIETNSNITLQEHNYTITPNGKADDNPGICLHVANGKVSLEFCASCSQNATKIWKELE